MYLGREDTREPVEVGTEITSFRGEKFILTGGREPRHQGSTGRVWFRVPGPINPNEFDQEAFPSVFGLAWFE